MKWENRSGYRKFVAGTIEGVFACFGHSWKCLKKVTQTSEFTDHGPKMLNGARVIYAWEHLRDFPEKNYLCNLGDLYDELDFEDFLPVAALNRHEAASRVYSWARELIHPSRRGEFCGIVHVIEPKDSGQFSAPCNIYSIKIKVSDKEIQRANLAGEISEFVELPPNRKISEEEVQVWLGPEHTAKLVDEILSENSND